MILKHVWVSHVKDELDLANPTETEVEFSYATEVVDNIGGWHAQLKAMKDTTEVRSEVTGGGHIWKLSGTR